MQLLFNGQILYPNHLRLDLSKAQCRDSETWESTNPSDHLSRKERSNLAQTGSLPTDRSSSAGWERGVRLGTLWVRTQRWERGQNSFLRPGRAERNASPLSPTYGSRRPSGTAAACGDAFPGFPPSSPEFTLGEAKRGNHHFPFRRVTFYYVAAALRVISCSRRILSLCDGS